MKNLFFGILLFILGIVVGIVLNLKFGINFGFDKILGNGVSSGFDNAIQAPGKMMNEAGNMLGF